MCVQVVMMDARSYKCASATEYYAYIQVDMHSVFNHHHMLSLHSHGNCTYMHTCIHVPLSILHISVSVYYIILNVIFYALYIILHV